MTRKLARTFAARQALHARGQHFIRTALEFRLSARQARAEIAAASIERLARLVNDILDLERLHSGQMNLSLQRVSAADLMRQAAEEVEVMAQSAGVTLSVSSREIPLEGDRDRLIQVLTNLLSNAIKFSPSGSTVSLTVDMEDGTRAKARARKNQCPIPNAPSSTVLFQVKDTGRGIPADKLESIFDRFQQVDASILLK